MCACVQELRLGQDAMGKLAAMSQFLESWSHLQGGADGSSICDVLTSDDLAAFEAISHSKSEPAHNRACALLCRGGILANLRTRHGHDAPRLLSKAAIAARVAQDSLASVELHANFHHTKMRKCQQRGLPCLYRLAAAEKHRENR